MAIAAPANAYPQETNNCNDRTLHWGFSGSGWTDSKKTWVRDGINQLDNALDYNGNRLISLTEDGGIQVKIRNDVPLSEGAGSSECTLGASLWVNGQPNTSRFYWKVGRHEMFHLAGAEHAGDQDSMNGDNPPTMVTCIDQSNFRTVNGLSQDDSAYLNWLWSSLDYRQLHANIGFEQGSSYWGVANGSLSISSSGGATGPSYARFTASGDETNSYIYQTVRLWTGDDLNEYRAKINARSPGPAGSYTTYARTGLYRRTLTENGDNSCDYADGLHNLNGPSVTSSYVGVSATSTQGVSDTWTSVASGFTALGAQDGYQFQVRAYGVTYSRFSDKAVYFDNVRGESS